MDDRERMALQGAARSARIAMRYAESTPDWQNDQKTVDAIAKRIEEVAENLRRVKPDRRATTSPAIRWNEAIAIREVIAHEYEEVDFDILTDVVQNGLPELISQIEAALSNGPT